jgi:GDP-L-fucose synthase
VLPANAKIFIAGHTGLIGSAIHKNLQSNGFRNLIVRRRTQLDLCNQENVLNFFEQERPDYVIVSAGMVGGIQANTQFPADFICQNLSIQLNVLQAARQHNVSRVINFGSSCMYPINSTQPMKESELLRGELEPTSASYAIAKIAGVQMCLAFNNQDGVKRFIPVIPNSTYGENDDLNPSTGHVLSALVRRFDDAKKEGKTNVTIWGSGQPYREFIHSSDVASACLKLLEADLSNIELPVNIGTGKEISIKELSELIKRIIGYSGDINWDHRKPDGAPRKLLDNQRIQGLGWQPQMDLEKGIRDFYNWYLQRN